MIFSFQMSRQKVSEVTRILVRSRPFDFMGTWTVLLHSGLKVLEPREKSEDGSSRV